MYSDFDIGARMSNYTTVVWVIYNTTMVHAPDICIDPWSQVIVEYLNQRKDTFNLDFPIK